MGAFVCYGVVVANIYSRALNSYSTGYRGYLYWCLVNRRYTKDKRRRLRRQELNGV